MCLIRGWEDWGWSQWPSANTKMQNIETNGQIVLLSSSLYPGKKVRSKEGRDLQLVYTWDVSSSNLTQPIKIWGSITLQDPKAFYSPRVGWRESSNYPCSPKSAGNAFWNGDERQLQTGQKRYLEKLGILEREGWSWKRPGKEWTLAD